MKCFWLYQLIGEKKWWTRKNHNSKYWKILTRFFNIYSSISHTHTNKQEKNSTKVHWLELWLVGHTILRFSWSRRIKLSCMMCMCVWILFNFFLPKLDYTFIYSNFFGVFSFFCQTIQQKMNEWMNEFQPLIDLHTHTKLHDIIYHH